MQFIFIRNLKFVAIELYPENKKMPIQDPRPMVFQLLNSTEAGKKLVETVSFRVDKKKEKRFLELAGGLVEDSLRNPGSFTLELHKLLPPNDQYTEFLLYEVWQDRDCLRKQWESDFLRVFQEKLMTEELLVAPPDLRFYRH
jgi:quinol monooxygenase YgiN